MASVTRPSQMIAGSPSHGFLYLPPMSMRKKFPSWRITVIRGNRAESVGTAPAADAKSAIKVAIRTTGSTDLEWHKRLVTSRTSARRCFPRSQAVADAGAGSSPSVMGRRAFRRTATRTRSMMLRRALSAIGRCGSRRPG